MNTATAQSMHVAHLLTNIVGAAGSTDLSSSGNAPTSGLMECDIGKLMESHTDLHQLSCENTYRILWSQTLTVLLSANTPLRI